MNSPLKNEVRKSYKALLGKKTNTTLVVSGCSIIVGINVAYLLLVERTIIIAEIT